MRENDNILLRRRKPAFVTRDNEASLCVLQSEQVLTNRVHVKRPSFVCGAEG